MSSIFAENVFFEILYKLIEKYKVQDLYNLYKKYVKAENIEDKDSFDIKAVVYLLNQFSEQYKNRIKFIKAGDFANTMLSFISYMKLNYTNEKLATLNNLLVVDIDKLLEIIDKSDAIKMIFLLLHEILNYQTCCDYYRLLFIYSKAPIDADLTEAALSITADFNVAEFESFGDSIEDIIKLIKDTDEYIYVIVDDKIAFEYDLDCISLPESLNINDYFKPLKDKLIQMFMAIIKSNLNLVPKYFYSSDNYSDLVISDGIHKGYKIYFDYEIDNLIKENEDIRIFINNEIHLWLLQNDKEYEAIDKYISYLDSNTDDDEQTKKEILEEYPEFEDMTIEELEQTLASMIKSVYDNTMLENPDYFINYLNDNNLIHFIEIRDNRSISEFISDSLSYTLENLYIFNIPFDVQKVFDYIQEYLDYEFDDDKLFVLLTILDNTFKQEYQIESYLFSNDKSKPIVAIISED